MRFNPNKTGLCEGSFFWIFYEIGPRLAKQELEEMEFYLNISATRI